MLLIHLLKILFGVLMVRHSIKWVSYHIYHKNKKARVFHGNCRMPKDVWFALMYGINKKFKRRTKDLSYRKSLEEWMQIINANYPTLNQAGNLEVKTANNNFIPRIKRFKTTGVSPINSITHLPYADLRQRISVPCRQTNANLTISSLKNLKNSQNTMPLPE
jgi:hypothetical protein